MDQVGFGFLIVLAPLIVYAVAHWYGRGDPLSRAVLSPIVPIRAPPAPKPKRSHHKRRAF